MSRSQEDFTDTGHFRPNVGASILATLLENRIEAGFGERLSSHGLDAYLNRQRAARAAWAVTNSDDFGKVHTAVLAAH